MTTLVLSLHLLTVLAKAAHEARVGPLDDGRDGGLCMRVAWVRCEWWW